MNMDKKTIRSLVMVFGVIAAVTASKGFAQEQQARRLLSEDRLFYFEDQHLTVSDFPAKGYILDIGGGGEGIIGQLKGSQVIAIDISKYELEASPSGPLKIIMDARDLKFLDEAFSTVTSFFTLMYINDRDHERVFDEIYRVLKKRGRFLIWDIALPRRSHPDKDIFIIPLSIELPEKTIRTRYGSHWSEDGRSLAYFKRLAGKAGFEIVSEKTWDRMFFIECRKR